MVNILFVNTGSPFPMTDGAGLRVVHLCELLSKKHTLTLLLFSSVELTEEQYEKISEIFTNIEIVKIPNKKSFYLTRKLGELFSKYKARRMIAKMNDERLIDVIHYHYPTAAIIVGPVKHIPGVFDLVDSLALYHERFNSQLEGASKISKLLSVRKISRITKKEKKLIDSFEITSVVSDADNKKIKSYSLDKPSICIPNGVDNLRFINKKKPSAAVCSIGFVGNMYFPPNVDAMTYFCKEIFPIILEHIPDVHLFIVGRRPVDSITKLQAGNSNITVTGMVDDVRTFVDDFSVFVAPMRIGGGIKNKILEAFSMERPVVTTDTGIEGIPGAQIGQHVMIENDPKKFAWKVITLLKNPEMRDEIGSNARKFVTKNYSWEKAADEYSNVYKKITNK